MRSATVGELAVLAGLTRDIQWRVKIANGSGTMIDLSSWVERVSRNEDVDQPVAGATIEFTRANGVLQTLSPLRTDSTLNVKDDLSYAPLLDLVRAITIEVATTASGVLPSGSDFKLKFKGTTQTVNFAGNPIVVECRDEGGELVDRWVEVKKLYGSIPGVAVETVMQSIHDDVWGAGVKPIWTPTSPGYLISPAYQQQFQSVMDADVALAQNPGWDFRSKWDDGTSAFRFKFYVPDRAKTIPDFTFGPSGYLDVTTLELSDLDVRNVIYVEYKDSADLGNRKTIMVFDSASITKYGRRPLFIIEGDNSPINTSAEATTMGNAALADLKDPKADFEIVAPFCWPLELGDLDRFSANAVHFNTDQDWAIVSITDDLSPGRHETRLRVRGSPAGQYMTWLARGETMGGGAGDGTVARPPYPFISPLDTEANDLTWDLRFNALAGSGGGGINLTYTIKSKKSFGSTVTLNAGNASAFPKDLTVTRDPKQQAQLIFEVTDAATGLSRQATWAIPSIKPFINATGDTITAGTNESGGKPINRLYAKPLPSDPDTADSVGAGIVRRVPLVGATDGTGNVDLSGVAWVNKHSLNLPRTAVDSTPISVVVQNVDNSGHAGSAMQEAGGKLINRLFAKPLAADPDGFDSVPDGTTYKRILAVSGGKATSGSLGALAVTDAAVNDVAAGKTTAGTLVAGVLESGGKAINRQLAKALAADPDTLDSTPDGTTYKKITGVVSSLITSSSSTPRNRCKVTLGGSNRTITTGTETALDWTGENYDSNALHDNATNNTRITVPSGGNVGVWDLICQIRWGSDATGYRELRLLKNGSTRIATVRTLAFSNGGEGPIMTITGKDDAPSVGDYYTCAAFHNQGTDAIIANSESFFAATHLW